MAITYPISLPSVGSYVDVNLGAVTKAALSISPYTSQQQVQLYEGDLWTGSFSLAPMKRPDAEEWITWLLKLRGMYGTFLFGDPYRGTPRGTTTSPTVYGADQTGYTLEVTGYTPFVVDVLKAGDYIQLGSGSGSQLYKVLNDVDANSSGDASLDIWPRLRSSPSNGSNVVVSNAKGVFRLASNDSSRWTVDRLQLFGISVPIMEAL